MEIFKTLILSLVQGLTEFLPISSSGHLAFFQELLNFKEPNVYFSVALHLGTLLAILTVYFRPFKKLSLEIFNFSNFKKPNSKKKFLYSLCLGTLPAAFVGWFFNEKIKILFSNLKAVSLFLCLTGVVLFFTKKKRETHFLTFNTNFPTLSIKQALLIGLAQALAVLPGISRSGLTIAMGLFLGLSGKNAALFSFSLSIPIILGAFFYEIQKYPLDFSNLRILVLGIFTSYVAGLIGLLLFIRFLKKGALKYFSYYLWVLGGAIFIFSLLNQ